MAVTVRRYNHTPKLFLNKQVDFTKLKVELLNAAGVAAYSAAHTLKHQADGGAIATVTMTIASPGVITDTAHGFTNGQVIELGTTGALPTGLSVGTSYYVINATTNTYQLSLTQGGAAINTSISQSGVHSRYSQGANEVSGNGWSPGGMLLTNVTAVIRTTSGAALTTDDLSVTATGGDIGPAYGCTIRDASTEFLLWNIDFGQVEQAGQETNMLIVFDPTGVRGTILLLA
jgi:hypothetical protein